MAFLRHLCDVHLLLQGLKKKAKKIQRKQDLGEQVVKQRVTSTHLKSGQANYASQLQVQEGVVDDGQENKSVYKVSSASVSDCHRGSVQNIHACLT